jgi:hypothetical protein
MTGHEKAAGLATVGHPPSGPGYLDRDREPLPKARELRCQSSTTAPARRAGGRLVSGICAPPG